MLRLSTFTADCTPPVGYGIGFGTGERAEGVRDPLLLRGLVLDDGACRCLLASLDYCALMHRAYDELCTALASAAGCEPRRVRVHCIHQHDTPLLDLEIDASLGQETFPSAWWHEVTARCAAAARAACADFVEVAAVGHRETRLAGYAANRRILGEDGRVAGVRWSRCADPALRDAPTGVIDPLLRTLAFRGRDERLLASLSFYATHPQVSNGRRLYSADAPGEAVRRVSASCPGWHAFFTGAGGNVTAGKFTAVADLEGNLLRFGARLAAGIEANLAGLQWETPGELAWREASFPFPAAGMDRERLRQDCRDEKRTAYERLLAAVLLSALEYPANQTYTVALLHLGSCRVLWLPGEPFVEHQLYAQSLQPDQFVALAANCSDNFLYLPTAAAFAQGGYEPTSFCWCTPAFEERLQQALRELLMRRE